MSTNNKPAPEARQSDNINISSADVKAYLQNHPDFFRENSALLGDLSLPHVSGNAVSLVEKQVAVLRDRSIKSRRKLGELIENAQENDSLFGKTQNLILRLLRAESSEELLTTVEKAFVERFDVEQCAIVLLVDEYAAGHGAAAGRTLQEERIKQLANAGDVLNTMIDSSETFCGALRSEEADFIFGGQAGECVTPSAAVTVRKLAPNALYGESRLLIAVGHSDGNHYGHDTGTIFIDYIADVVTILLDRLLADS